MLRKNESPWVEARSILLQGMPREHRERGGKIEEARRWVCQVASTWDVVQEPWAASLEGRQDQSPRD